MKALAVHVKSICDRKEHTEAKQDFLKLLKLSLWANRLANIFFLYIFYAVHL